MVEQSAVNRLVVGSSPALGAMSLEHGGICARSGSRYTGEEVNERSGFDCFSGISRIKIR